MVDHEDPPELGQLRDNSVLWRASLWGGAAAVALATAILMTQTDIGSQRLHLMFAADPAPSRVATQADFTPRADPDAQKRETMRLEAQVRELAADRERLNARIAALEQNLSDMTGSIKRELAAVAATGPAAPPPAPAAPATMPAGRAQAAQTPPALQPLPASQGTQADQEAQAGHELGGKEADTLLQVAAPLGDPIPLPPMRVATATVGEPNPTASGKDIGIDLGGARSLEIMQARWAAVKANFGPLLNGLHPLVAHDPRPKMIPYRLIVGPLPNAAAAAQVCARFAASKVTCRTTKFAGEQLAMPQ
ncbi:MAG: hypothetical protein PSV22_14685 [Pseudolabrys sp.]|nr:hypothetical protein [Pseudolabrys sp.]